jgi:hypothetical protein
LRFLLFLIAHDHWFHIHDTLWRNTRFWIDRKFDVWFVIWIIDYNFMLLKVSITLTVCISCSDWRFRIILIFGMIFFIVFIDKISIHKFSFVIPDFFASHFRDYIVDFLFGTDLWQFWSCFDDIHGLTSWFAMEDLLYLWLLFLCEFMRIFLKCDRHWSGIRANYHCIEVVYHLCDHFFTQGNEVVGFLL